MTLLLNRARCPECGKDVATLVPKNGTGDVEVFRRHKVPDGRRCFYSRAFVRQEDYTVLEGTRLAAETGADS